MSNLDLKSDVTNVGWAQGHFVWSCPITDEERAALLAWAKAMRQCANQLSKAAKA